MKHEINLEKRLLRLIPTCPQDERFLHDLDSALGDALGTEYALVFRAASGSLGKLQDQRLEELRYTVVAVPSAGY